MSYLSIVLEKLAKFFRGYFFGTPGIWEGVLFYGSATLPSQGVEPQCSQF